MVEDAARPLQLVCAVTLGRNLTVVIERFAKMKN
jgi:hypothetical protein